MNGVEISLQEMATRLSENMGHQLTQMEATMLGFFMECQFAYEVLKMEKLQEAQLRAMITNTKK